MYFDDIHDFLTSGGYVLWVIFFVSIILWTLIIERYYYIFSIHPHALKNIMSDWNKRTDKSSWTAIKIRDSLIAVTNLKLNDSLTSIHVLVMLCPMLGLLGTVTGMIHVFDVMSVVGSGNARAMASGVSMATIPTMAGLATALSGFYFSIRLKQHTKRLINELECTILIEGESNASSI